MPKHFLLLALSIIVLAAAGTFTWNYLWDPQKGGPDVVLAVTLFAISIGTFFGFMMIGSKHNWQLTRGGMRISIAATLVISYLFMVAFVLFLLPDGTTVNPLVQSFVQSFSGIVGVTVAFYFGSAAAVQIFGKEKAPPVRRDSEPESTE